MDRCDNENLYAFVLGREQKIALAELESVLRRFGFDFCEDGSHPGQDMAGASDVQNNPCYSIISLLDNVAIIKMEKAVSCKLIADSLFPQLGGTVKIFQIISNFECPMSNNGMEASILDILGQNDSTGTLNFGLSDYSARYSAKQLSEMGIKIKIQARKKRPVRFVASKEPDLSSATSYHKIWKTGGEEMGIFNLCKSTEGHGSNTASNNEATKPCSNELVIGRLVATSSPDEWSKRDYGKPKGDKFSGMMPPKLARMMVNLALGQIESTKHEARSTKQIQISNLEKSKIISDFEFRGSDLRPLVLDPFCGSGNILMEALMLGCRVIGSDLSEKAVTDTIANLNWLADISSNNEVMRQFNNGTIFQADATTFDFVEKLKNFRIEEPKNIVVVTEPYLGKPKKIKNQKSKIKDEVAELKHLYLSFFKNLSTIIHNSSFVIQSICFAFPLIETADAGAVSLYDECIDDLREMGYNTERTLGYGRDYQVVKRQIVILTIKQ